MRYAMMLMLTMALGAGCGGRSGGLPGAGGGGGGAADLGAAVPLDGCVRPPGMCTYSGSCPSGTICSTLLGICQADPCCPKCEHCVGRCIQQTFLVEAITAYASADLMPPLPGRLAASVQLEYKNRASASVTGVKIKEAALILNPGKAAPVQKLDLKPVGAFSGTVGPGKTVRVSYAAKASVMGAPCNKQVSVQAMVAYGPAGVAVTATSPAFKFGCSH